ncbi:hypothetical protein DNTS_031186 [Danionella cerebrum]|uniref:Uncharacterized protein n=1 Tax=Danionella cerebrum TaxID=2873325 RepID=A0A553RPB3_9TELE|nr:hypothetical protein DNTS_031186 [Danionella translucida]
MLCEVQHSLYREYLSLL